MIVTDPHGQRWATVAHAATIARVHKDTIWAWATRGKVRRHNVAGTSWVSLDDVLDAELAWRKRVTCRRQGRGVR